MRLKYFYFLSFCFLFVVLFCSPVYAYTFSESEIVCVCQHPYSDDWGSYSFISGYGNNYSGFVFINGTIHYFSKEPFYCVSEYNEPLAAPPGPGDLNVPLSTASDRCPFPFYLSGQTYCPWREIYVPYISFDSWDDFYANLSSFSSYDEWYAQHKDVFNPPPPKESLPLPALTMTHKNVFRVGIPAITHNSYINWDYTSIDLYKNNPNAYGYEVRYSYSSDNLQSVDITNSYPLDNGSIVSNSSSFNNYEVSKKIAQREGISVPQNIASFHVYFRVVSFDGSAVSLWKDFYISAANASPSYHEGGTYDEQGNIKTESDYSVKWDAPSGTDDSSSSTSASQNKDSDIYDDGSSVSSTSVYNTLKSNVETVKNISSLLATCYQWFPSWLLSLISASIGIVVVVGLIKFIRG